MDDELATTVSLLVSLRKMRGGAAGAEGAGGDGGGGESAAGLLRAVAMAPAIPVPRVDGRLG